MAPARIAELISRYRHAATLAIAGAVALVMTLGTRRTVFQPGFQDAIKYFVFVFVAVAVIVAIALTIALVIAETKAEAAKRVDVQLPTAIALPKHAAVHASPTPAAPASATPAVVAQAPRIEPAKSTPLGPGDEPSILR
jgi:hypothetical protein